VSFVKILMVISEDLFRDEEFAEPFKLYTSAGHKVTVASTSLKEAVGELGMRLRPEITLDDVDPAEFDAISIAGGDGTPTYLWSNTRLHWIVDEMSRNGKVVGAICFAPVVLAKAGLLKGKKCTVWRTPESVSEIENAGCLLLPDHVVVDGNIVTGDGPEAAVDFGRAVLRVLGK
jgi:protease I